MVVKSNCHIRHVGLSVNKTISITGGKIMNVRENIFRLMEERGMTQKEFSERSGIAESTVSDWKRKQLNPGVDKLPMICRTLGVTSDALLGIDAAASDYVISDDVLKMRFAVNSVKALPQILERVELNLKASAE